MRLGDASFFYARGQTKKAAGDAAFLGIAFPIIPLRPG